MIEIMIKNKILIALFYVLIAKFSFALEYTINFMWLYDTPTPEERFIFPEVRKKSAEVNNTLENWNVNIIDDWLSHWLKENPEGKFVFWYDEKTVTPEQIKNTINEFNILQDKFLTKGGSINIKSISSLNLIEKYPELSSMLIPIYLKTDLFRIAAAIEFVEKCKEECGFVYVDVDKRLIMSNGKIIGMDISNKYIFSSDVIRGLKKDGLVLKTGSENSFFILSNYNKNMINSLNTIVINSNIYRLKNMLSKMAILKNKMLENSASSKEVEDFAEEIVNRVFTTMGAPLIHYYHYLEGNIELIAKNRSNKDFDIIFSELDNVFGSGVRKAFDISINQGKESQALKNVEVIDVGGSPTVSTNTSAAIDRLYGKGFYNSWKNSYDILDREKFHQDIIKYLKKNKYITSDARANSYIPASVKAEEILFISSNGDKEKVVKIFKDIDECEKEAALIEPHNRLISEIENMNKNNLIIPIPVKSEASFKIGNRCLILMEKANGEPLSKIIYNLEKIDINQLEKIFNNLGKSRGNLDALYVLNKEKIIYSKDQHSDNVFFDQKSMKVSWIDLELFEGSINDLGLLNNLDKDNYFFDIIRNSQITKYSNMPFDDGLKKYFTMLTAFIGSYMQALKDSFPEKIFIELTSKQNKLLKDKLIMISKSAIDKFILYKKTTEKNKSIESSESHLRQIRRETTEIVKSFLKTIFKEPININEGKTELHEAIYANNFELVSLLVKTMDQKSLEQQDGDGNTALHLAVNLQNISLVKILLKVMSQESINKQDNHGFTALHLAVDLDNFKLVKILLDTMNIKGINAKNKLGKSALDWAKRNKSEKIINLIILRLNQLSSLQTYFRKHQESIIILQMQGYA